MTERGPGTDLLVTGKVQVQANTVVSIDHVQGTEDQVEICLDTFTACSTCQAPNGASHRIPAAAPTGTYEVTVPVSAVFNANPGTMVVNSYYLLATSPSGSASTDRAQWAFVDLLYIPD